MGIRMAMGAAPRNIVGLVLKDGMIQLAVGISVGLFLGVTLSRGAQAVMFDAQATDPIILGGVIATLVTAGVAASLAPAFRATRADPVRSLRAE